MKPLEKILGTLTLTAALLGCQPQHVPQEGIDFCGGGLGGDHSPASRPARKPAFTTLYKDNNAYAPEGEKTVGFVLNNPQALNDLYKKINFSFSFDAEGKRVQNVPSFTPDFGKEMVIAVFQGKRNTAGHSIEITDIVEKAGNLFVVAQLREASKDVAYAQVLQAPAHLVVYRKTEKPAVFVWNTKNPLAERILPAKYLITHPKPLEYNFPPQASREEKIQVYETINKLARDVIEKDCATAGISIEKFIDKRSFIASFDSVFIPFFEKKGYSVQKLGIEMK